MALRSELLSEFLWFFRSVEYSNPIEVSERHARGSIASFKSRLSLAQTGISWPAVKWEKDDSCSKMILPDFVSCESEIDSFPETFRLNKG